MTGHSDAELIDKIESLKKSRNAVILAHNYQLGEVQDIADYVGDTLEVCLKVADTKADVIVACGVEFMAETASIIHPGKTILLPDKNAGCPMANMITAERLKEKKSLYLEATVICYINTPAAVKAESDICCTSVNAVRIVDKLPAGKQIMFVPDQYLGDYISTKTGRDIILWPGYCPTHIKIQPQDIIPKKEEHPDAKVIVHPECIPSVRAIADEVLGTGEIVSYARESEAKTIIVGTEIGILHRLKKESPEKEFILATERAVCRRMKLINLETVLWSLENMTHVIKVPEDISLKAKSAVDKMLEG